MQFLFYHSTDFPCNNFPECKTIWVPLGKQVDLFIKHLKIKFPTAAFSSEKILQPFLKADNVKIIDHTPKDSPVSKRKFVFYAQSDTLAKSALNIIKHLKEEEYVLIIPQKSTESAEKPFINSGLKYHTYSYQLLKSLRPAVLVLFNDWSKEARRIISHSRILNIPNVCIQESIIDFGDNFKRMQHSDNALIQGAQTIIELNRKSYYITGNPRYENIQENHPAKQKALINCNFTYNIFEEVRDRWLSDIVQALEEKDTDYVISQHPRDTGDLSTYKNVSRSSAELVQQQLAECTILITRFSSLIHEALIAGKQVIYYNPHGENMQYDFGFNNRFLRMAKSKEDLAEAIGGLVNSTPSRDMVEDYLSVHCIQKNSIPSHNIIYLLQYAKFKISFSVKDFIQSIIFHPVSLGMFRKIKNILKA